MTMNVPLLMLENALDVPWSATGFDISTMEQRVAAASAELMGIEPHRVHCELLHTKFAPADPQFVLAPGDDPMPPIAVQLCIWSQWTKEAAKVKKTASWVPPPPPRSAPRPARNYLITASYEVRRGVRPRTRPFPLSTQTHSPLAGHPRGCRRVSALVHEI